MTEVRDVKEAANYLMALAMKGRITMSPQEADAVLQNIRSVSQLIDGLPDDGVITRPDCGLEPIERVADLEAELSRTERELESAA